MLALAAGADALCLGHDIDESHVALRPRGDRRGGRERAARRGAARRGGGARRRVARSRSRRRQPRRRRSPRSGSRRRGARCSVDGSAGGAGPLLVVELEGTLSVAAGPPAHDLASILARARRRRRGVRLDEPATSTAAVAASRLTRAAGPWSSCATSTAIRGSATAARDRRRRRRSGGRRRRLPEPATPLAAARRVTTFGAGRASLTAAAELLVP